MLETILTRIILRYANRYIRDTFTTDSFSLWSGDLVLRNFELRTDELAQIVGAIGEDGLRLASGFVRELRIHVPWNAIRSQSLRIEVDAVEVVFSQSVASGDGEVRHLTSSPPSTPISSKASTAAVNPAPTGPAQTQEGLDETNETWLQPLLNTIFGNIVVVANNLVAKVPRSGVAGCLTVAKLDSHPHSPRWAAGFNSVSGVQPMLHRVIAVRDMTVTLDPVATQERRRSIGGVRRGRSKLGNRAPKPTAELPVLHRFSLEVFVEWPLLPWAVPVNPAPTSRIDVHLSPARVRLSNDKIQLLMRLVQPDNRHGTTSSLSGGGFEHELDSGSDQVSLRSGVLPSLRSATTSEPSTAATTTVMPTISSAHVSGMSSSLDDVIAARQLSNSDVHLAMDSEDATRHRSMTPQSIAVGSSSSDVTCDSSLGDEIEVDAGKLGPIGFKGWFVDVLFGDDDDDADDETTPVVVPREVRRSYCLVFCMPIFSVSFEQFKDTSEMSNLAGSLSPAMASAASRESMWQQWLCKLSFVGLSSFIVIPPRGDDSPLEGSVELHHVTLQIPGSLNQPDAVAVTALAWGSPLKRLPLESDEAALQVKDSLARARAWTDIGCRLLEESVEFPHPSHSMMALEGSRPLSEVCVGVGQAAVRAGLLLISSPATDQGVKSEGFAWNEAAQCDVFRASVQVAKARLDMDLTWLGVFKAALRPVFSSAADAMRQSRRSVAPEKPLQIASSRKVVEAVVSFAGMVVTFEPFIFELGPVRADWRDFPHGLEQASLASKLRETTVFISSAFSHLVWHSFTGPPIAIDSHDGAIAFVKLSVVSLKHQFQDVGLESSMDPTCIADQPLHFQDLFCIIATPDVCAPVGSEPGVTHVEMGLGSGLCNLSLWLVNSLCQYVKEVIDMFSQVGLAKKLAFDSPAEGFPTLTVKLQSSHMVVRSIQYTERDVADVKQGPLRSALGWAGSFSRKGSDDADPGLSSSESEDDSPLLENLPQPRSTQTLRASQFYLFVGRLNIAFEHSALGQQCVILAPYDLRPHSSLLEELRATEPEAGKLKHPRNAMLSVICQLCPVTQSGFCPPPKLQTLVPIVDGIYGSTLLQNFRQCCCVWITAIHVQIDPRWVSFVDSLCAAVSPLHSAVQRAEVKPVMEAPDEDTESLSACALCSIYGVVLPSSIWLTLPDRPIACLTLPLVLASQPHLQLNGLHFNVFNELEHLPQFNSILLRLGDDVSYPLPAHSLQQLRQCFFIARCSQADVFIADAAATEGCLSISRLSSQTWRQEQHTKSRPEVSFKAHLNVSSVQWRVESAHVNSLSSWMQTFLPIVRNLSEAHQHGPPQPHESFNQPSSPPLPTPTVLRQRRVRLTFYINVSASAYGLLRAPAGCLNIKLPGLLWTFRHSTDFALPRMSMKLRLSRLNAVLMQPPMPELDIVEWCEEKVHGDDTAGQLQRRSAFWLVVSLQKQGRKPPELIMSSLPLGLCLPIAPLCRVLVAFLPALEPNPDLAEPQVASPSTDVVATRVHRQGTKMRMQISLNAVSVRLFAASPFTSGAPHLAICFAEASASRGAEEALRVRAVVSVSLFEQSVTDEWVDASSPVTRRSASELSPVCVLDDVIKPCTITFFEQPPAPEGLDLGIQVLEADPIHLEIPQRQHLCTLVLLGLEYLHCIDDLVLPYQAVRAEGVSSANMAHPNSIDSRQLRLNVNSVLVYLPGRPESDRTPIYHLGGYEISCILNQRGVSSELVFSSKTIEIALCSERQKLEVSGLAVNLRRSASEFDITINIDGSVSAKLCTGYLFDDVLGIAMSDMEKSMLSMKGAKSLSQSVQTEQITTVEALADQVEPDTVSTKFKLIASSIFANLQTSPADSRCLSLNAMNFSFFSWPPVCLTPPTQSGQICKITKSSVDVSVEALSAMGGGPGVPTAPLLSPFSLQASIVTLSPVPVSFGFGRKEIRLHLSPVCLSAGAWQVRLLSDVFSFQDAASRNSSSDGTSREEEKGSEQIATQSDEEKPTSVCSQEFPTKRSELMFVELNLEQDGSCRAGDNARLEDKSVEVPYGFSLPILRSVPVEELDPWQAVQLADDVADERCCYAMCLGRPARVSAVAICSMSHIPGGEAVLAVPADSTFPIGSVELEANIDYDIEAWDNVQGQFIDVTTSAKDNAICSCLLALRLALPIVRASSKILVCLETPIPQDSSMELLIQVSTPRLTWSALHMGVAPLATCGASVPALEESFGDVAFHNMDFMFWQSKDEGMVIHTKAGKVGIELYDMTTLSLTQIVKPLDNYLSVSVKIAQSGAPSLMPMKIASHRSVADCYRKPVIDVALGIWRVQVLPWSLSRLSQLVQGVVSSFGFTPQLQETDLPLLAPSSRLPLVIRNALPIPIVFGQAGAVELVSLASGAERGYIWKNTDPQARSLVFAMHAQAPVSEPISLLSLPGGDAPMWARLELQIPSAENPHDFGTGHLLYLCIRRMSLSQCVLMVMPPVLLFSCLSDKIEFSVVQGSDHVHCSANSVLESREFMLGLPAQSPTSKSLDDVHEVIETTRNVDVHASSSDASCILRPCTFVGVLPKLTQPCGVHFRRSGDAWGPLLPLDVVEKEPYTTLVPLLSEIEGETQNVMCKCHDLGAIARTQSGAKDNKVLEGFQVLGNALLPNVLQIWPLLVVHNKCPSQLSVCISSMGIVEVGANECLIPRATADPRQLTAVEFRISSSMMIQAHLTSQHTPEDIFSSGPLLVSGLTQFHHNEADEKVSWQNSVRCRNFNAIDVEVLLLVEIRRCALSGVIRSLIIEPMWTFQNELGEEVFLRSLSDDRVLHVADKGHSIAYTLGDLQNDPSFPFEALIGIKHSEAEGGIAWSIPQRCAMGKTTRVEIFQGTHCSVLLVSVRSRHQNAHNSIVGGVNVQFFSAAYISSEIEIGLKFACGSNIHLVSRVPAKMEAGVVVTPWLWWPSVDAMLMRDLLDRRKSSSTDGVPASGESGTVKRSKISIRVRADDEHGEIEDWSDEVPLALACERNSRSRSVTFDTLIDDLPTLLVPTGASLLSSGHARDLQIHTHGRQQSMLLNVTYQLHSQGCINFTVMRSSQPPLVCVNFTSYAVQVAEPWCGPSSPSSRPCLRLPPGGELERACPPLRTMEVFPPEGVADMGERTHRSGSPANTLVRTRFSMAELGDTYIDFALTVEADIPWEVPGVAAFVVNVRYASGVCRVELRDVSSDSSKIPAVLPMGRSPLSLSVDVLITVCDAVVNCYIGNDVEITTNAKDKSDSRRMAMHVLDLKSSLRFEAETSERPLLRDQASRTNISLSAHLLSVADIGRAAPSSPLKQVLAVPAVDLQIRLYRPPYKLPISYEQLHVVLSPVATEGKNFMVCVDDSFIEIVQVLVEEIASEFLVDLSAASPTKGDSQLVRSTRDIGIPSATREEFRYLFLGDFSVSALPLYVDLQLSSHVFLSFTGLEITFPETRLRNVAANSFVLGQELIAHCIAFLLLNSPFLLGSCDLLGNPVQAYRHLREGVSDLLHRPLRDGFTSFARHVSSASLTSVSAVADSLRRNLPNSGLGESSASMATASGENGLRAGLRALAGGVGRGLSGIVYWEQHTPNREGAFGRLRGARNAVTGAVAHPVGGFLDLVTTTARGWAATEASIAPLGPHPLNCQACLEQWPLHHQPDVSPLKFHLQCCQGLPPPFRTAPALLFWSPRCELVRVDGAGGAGGRCEPNLRLIRAGLVLTTAQVCVLVDECTAHVLDIKAVQAVEEQPGRPSALVTIASSSGLWQLHVWGEPGEFVAHLRRARRLAGLPPGVV